MISSGLELELTRPDHRIETRCKWGECVTEKAPPTAPKSWTPKKLSDEAEKPVSGLRSFSSLSIGLEGGGQ